MSKLQDFIYNKLPIFVQNGIISYYGWKITRERYGKKFEENLDFLEKSQYFSDNEIKEYQRERLIQLINHAYNNVPYYRNIFTKLKLLPKDFKDINDLHKLPILTKGDIRNNFNNLISINCDKKQLKLGHTSGTTGSPLEILWDKNIILMTNAVLWRQRNWAGLKFGDRFATIFGRIIVPISQTRPPFWRYNIPHKQLWLSSFHLTKENIKFYFEKLEKFKPTTIEGYPSNIFILAKYLESINTTFPVNSILTTSETLHQLQREIIEERFCCKVFDYYGMAERVIFATECEKHEGHHLNDEYSIAEIIKPNGESAEAGEMGRLVATGLHNLGMPLIRYATSDVSLLKKVQCSCGRTLPLLDDVTTKAEDIITTMDGRYISASALTHPFKPLRGVDESQIIQEDKDRIRIKIVKGKSYKEHDTAKLLNEMKKRIGSDMQIQVEFVDKIPRGPNGKFRWVISKVPLDLS